ncbi:MAG TPA: YgiQ family radical SAM protein [Methanospirillum sp.]|nr:YgiQ family radical SAM protein [Methanospirillum sp.]
MPRLPQPRFLPVSRQEADKLGIDQFDIILVSGDAYLDHPASATALLGRSLWDAGYTVGVIALPEWKEPASFAALGVPRLFFSVSAGSMDPMVAHYTPAQKRRSEDSCSPGGKPARPDRATLVYSDLIHRTFPHVRIVIGGVEASLRRFAHYDYWSDRIRQSLLADAPADILVYGMGEQQLKTIADRAAAGEDIRRIRDIPGTVWKIAPKEWAMADIGVTEVPSFSTVSTDPEAFARAQILITTEQNPCSGRAVLQRHPKTFIIQNPPAQPLTSAELDHLYELPYRREAHPSYQEPIPALEPIRFSITSHRGCYGNCSFCALAMHQGRIIQSRSEESILREIRKMARMPGFRGTISDIGGPAANMYGDVCPRWALAGPCADKDCTTCSSRQSGFSRYLNLLDDAMNSEGVKHVFVGSGLRYDLIPPTPAVLARICSHVSGQLKVAPEHITPEVTRLMNKPDGTVFEAFRRGFEDVQREKKDKKRQYIIPYMISGHPGCTVPDMIALAEYLRDHHLYTEQVQDFTPTPMTISTCMYATGFDPRTMERVHIPKGEEKRIQRAILQYRDPSGYDLVRQGLMESGRADLIGDRPDCLISRQGPERAGKPLKGQSGSARRSTNSMVLAMKRTKGTNKKKG